jgi:prepilin signal peptidase PulO-like enzyme (type II secretory pathway)
MALTFSLEWIPLITAFAGTIVAAGWDLKTTEVPDEVFYAMFGIGFGYYIFQSYISASLMPFLSPLLFGGAMFAIGYTMYKLGQWGGADAFLLTAVAFLLPAVPGSLGFDSQTFFPFPFSYFINVFLIGTPYMLVYAAIIAARNRRVQQSFSRDMKASAKTYLSFAAALFVLLFGVSYYLSQAFSVRLNIVDLVRNSIIPVIAALGLFVIYRFGKSVEDFAFRKKIPVSKLKIGDVLLESKQFVGISARKIAAIKRSGKKYVVIKEGVRFAPAFPLALLFTLLYGDAIFLLFKYFVGF